MNFDKILNVRSQFFFFCSVAFSYPYASTKLHVDELRLFGLLCVTVVCDHIICLFRMNQPGQQQRRQQQEQQQQRQQQEQQQQQQQQQHNFNPFRTLGWPRKE